MYRYDTVEPLSIRTSLTLDTFICLQCYLTTSKMGTPHYSEHFNLAQWCRDSPLYTHTHTHTHTHSHRMEPTIAGYCMAEITMTTVQECGS